MASSMSRSAMASTRSSLLAKCRYTAVWSAPSARPSLGRLNPSMPSLVQQPQALGDDHVRASGAAPQPRRGRAAPARASAAASASCIVPSHRGLVASGCRSGPLYFARTVSDFIAALVQGIDNVFVKCLSIRDKSSGQRRLRCQADARSCCSATALSSTASASCPRAPWSGSGPGRSATWAGGQAGRRPDRRRRRPGRRHAAAGLHRRARASGLRRRPAPALRPDRRPDRRRVPRLIAAYARAHPDGRWITGGGWSMEAFPGGVPTKDLLDAVVPDRPVYLPNRDGHGAWVNSRALELAGIDASTPDPADGRIERDAAGEPVGMLQEGATGLVSRLLPEPTDGRLVRGPAGRPGPPALVRHHRLAGRHRRPLG